MKFLIKLKRREYNAGIQRFIRQRSKRLSKYLSSNAKLTWNCSFDGQDELCTGKISGFKGPEIKATGKSKNFYKSVDLVIDRLEKQLSKKHFRQTHRHSDKEHLEYSDFGFGL